METSCWHCHKKLPVLKRLAGELFCSEEHEEEYLREQSALAVARLTDPAMSASGMTKAPLRLRPAEPEETAAPQQAAEPEETKAPEAAKAAIPEEFAPAAPERPVPRETVPEVWERVREDVRAEASGESPSFAGHIWEAIHPVDQTAARHWSPLPLDAVTGLVHPQFQPAMSAELRGGGPLRQASEPFSLSSVASEDRAEPIPGQAFVELPVERVGLGETLGSAELLAFRPRASAGSAMGASRVEMGRMQARELPTGSGELSFPALRVAGDARSPEGRPAASFGYLGMERSLVPCQAAELAPEREADIASNEMRMPVWAGAHPVFGFADTAGLELESGTAKVLTLPVRGAAERWAGVSVSLGYSSAGSSPAAGGFMGESLGRQRVRGTELPVWEPRPGFPALTLGAAAWGVEASWSLAEVAPEGPGAIAIGAAWIAGQQVRGTRLPVWQGRPGFPALTLGAAACGVGASWSLAEVAPEGPGPVAVGAARMGGQQVRGTALPVWEGRPGFPALTLGTAAGGVEASWRLAEVAPESPRAVSVGAARIGCRQVRGTALPVWEGRPGLEVLEEFHPSSMALAHFVDNPNVQLGGTQFTGRRTRLPDTLPWVLQESGLTQGLPGAILTQDWTAAQAGIPVQEGFAVESPVSAVSRLEVRQIRADVAAAGCFPHSEAVSIEANGPRDEAVRPLETVRPARGSRQARIAATTLAVFHPMLGTRDGIQGVLASADAAYDPGTLGQMRLRWRSHLPASADAPPVTLSAGFEAPGIWEPASEGANSIQGSSVPGVGISMGSHAGGTRRVRESQGWAVAEEWTPRFAGELRWDSTVFLAGFWRASRPGEGSSIAALDLKRLHPSSLLVIPSPAGFLSGLGLASWERRMPVFLPVDAQAPRWGEGKF
ncbi:MAG TPA: hypothetical protein VGN17_22475 [Bryobacteraceae bacterium]